MSEDRAREIIASFLLWHDPAYKPGRYETLEKIIAEANDFLWPQSPPSDEERAKARDEVDAAKSISQPDTQIDIEDIIAEAKVMP